MVVRSRKMLSGTDDVVIEIQDWTDDKKDAEPNISIGFSNEEDLPPGPMPKVNFNLRITKDGDWVFNVSSMRDKQMIGGTIDHNGQLKNLHKAGNDPLYSASDQVETAEIVSDELARFKVKVLSAVTKLS